MLAKEKIEQLTAILGDLTEEQKAALIEGLEKGMSDKALLEKLGGADEGKLAEFLKAVEMEKEAEVFGQELAPEELEGVAGGGDPSDTNCTDHTYGRNIYYTGFPNCAATVEDGSFCWTNDACWNSQVIYKFMNDCSKAWR